MIRVGAPCLTLIGWLESVLHSNPPTFPLTTYAYSTDLQEHLSCDSSYRFHQLYHPPRELGEASSWLVYLPIRHTSRLSFPHTRPFPMTSPSSPALQPLHRLNRISPDFHDKLKDLLYGEEYVQCVPTLQGEDLVWLVDYLDKVCRRVILPQSLLKPA